MHMRIYTHSRSNTCVTTNVRAAICAGGGGEGPGRPETLRNDRARLGVGRGRQNRRVQSELITGKSLAYLQVSPIHTIAVRKFFKLASTACTPRDRRNAHNGVVTRRFRHSMESSLLERLRSLAALSVTDFGAAGLPPPFTPSASACGAAFMSASSTSSAFSDISQCLST